MLALGVFFIAFVGFIQQDVPASVVIVTAEINDLFFLLVAQVVRAIVENRHLLAAKERRRRALDFSIFPQLVQPDVKPAAGVELIHVLAKLLQQVVPVGQHQHIVDGDFTALHQYPQHFQQLDDHQRLAGAGCHPE